MKEMKSSSHPTWVRGLKPVKGFLHILELNVAPYVGAWIETFSASCLLFTLLVAPYVGAWIETEDAL